MYRERGSNPGPTDPETNAFITRPQTLCNEMVILASVLTARLLRLIWNYTDSKSGTGVLANFYIELKIATRFHIVSRQVSAIADDCQIGFIIINVCVCMCIHIHIYTRSL